MKNLFVTLWVLNSFIGTSFLSNELQDDENYFASASQHDYFNGYYAGKKFQNHSFTFIDFDFEYLLLVKEKSVQIPLSENIIKRYCFVFTPQTSILPHLYDLPPPYSMV